MFQSNSTLRSKIAMEGSMDDVVVKNIVNDGGEAMVKRLEGSG